ncbi:hypothetical protein SDC9_99581 [bioreactor metagenome]|uniref:Uncharacterized protein n=1 Tax=bioreactor metagenome TaxID=1076179 RepID=A0A645AJA7_9ZZZZ
MDKTDTEVAVFITYLNSRYRNPGIDGLIRDRDMWSEKYYIII